MTGGSRADWDARYARRPPVPGEPPAPAVVEFVTGLPHGRALDLGCGAGRNALWLASRGWRVDAVDVSAVALEHAAATAATATRAIRERLRWVHAHVTALTLPPGYDLALLCYVHLPSAARRSTIESALASLEPEGTLVIVGYHDSTPDEGSAGAIDPEILYRADDLVADVGEGATVVTAADPRGGTPGSPTPETVVVARRSTVGKQSNPA